MGSYGLLDEWDRDMLLPFARRSKPLPEQAAAAWREPADVMRTLDARQGNRWQFGVPQFMADMGGAAGAIAQTTGAGLGPARRPSEHPEATEAMIGHAGSVVGPMAAAGMGRAAVAPRGGAELGMFGAPPHIQRLQQAGRIQPGARGSMEALTEAKAEWAKGNLDTWSAHGWESPDATGGVIKQPFAWHDTSDIKLRPEFAAPLEKHREGGGSRDYNNRDGLLQDVVHGRGLEDLMIAEPGLRRARAEIGMVDGISGEIGRDGRSVVASGPNRATIEEVLAHELGGHGPLVTSGAIDFSKSPARGTPIAGTAAEAAQTNPNRAALARELAGYFATVPEHLARVDMMTAANPRLLDTVSPMRIDSYVPEALPGGRGVMGLPLRDFRPPLPNRGG